MLTACINLHTFQENYTLPDGRVIKLGRERFEAPEALFTPSLVDSEKPGMADMVFEMIQAADIDMRVEYFKHIVLSGKLPSIVYCVVWYGVCLRVGMVVYGAIRRTVYVIWCLVYDMYESLSLFSCLMYV